MTALSVLRLAAGTFAAVFAFAPALAFAAALALAAPRAAFAHGGVSLENDICKLRVGPYMMHFTGYQPFTAPELEFCEDIPATGKTIIVLDFLDQKLRDLPVDARIIRDTGRDTGDDSNQGGITVFHLQPAVYPKGTIVLEHTFEEPGRFVGLVTVGDHVSRFPFAVGTGGRRAMMQYLTCGAVALAIGGGLYAYSSRRILNDKT